MRRIVLVLVVIVVLAIAGYMLLRPKRAPARSKSRTAQTDSTGTVRPAGTRRTSGRVAGTLKASTKEERRTKARQIKAAERARKRALKRAEREKRRMLSRSARGRRGRTPRSGSQLYVLKAVVATAGENYALVDGRRVQIGDFVLGRKIVSISPDRIEIEAFGKRSTVRVGESLLPSSYVPTKRR